jgi:hypothetical protein
VVIDGVFAAATAGAIIFHAATGLDAPAVAAVPAQVRRRVVPGNDSRAMAQRVHGGGFSVDGSVRIEPADRVERDHLLRYCGRPAFALDLPC